MGRHVAGAALSRFREQPCFPLITFSFLPPARRRLLRRLPLRLTCIMLYACFMRTICVHADGPASPLDDSRFASALIRLDSTVLVWRSRSWPYLLDSICYARCYIHTLPSPNLLCASCCSRIILHPIQNHCLLCIGHRCASVHVHHRHHHHHYHPSL